MTPCREVPVQPMLPSNSARARPAPPFTRPAVLIRLRRAPALDAFAELRATDARARREVLVCGALGSVFVQDIPDGCRET
jgi:hypothetical protein